jgi:hypothetical protein
MSNNGKISAGKLLLPLLMSRQGSAVALFRQWKGLLELVSSTRTCSLKLLYVSSLFDRNQLTLF